MPDRAPLSKEIFRDAMARLASAVTIITTDGENGRHGFTASAVCSVSDDPATLLVCVNRSASTHAHLVRHNMLAINILAHEQEALSTLFGSSRYDMETRFASGAWRKGELGMPLLEGALVTLECRISLTQEIGTHSVFFVEPLCAEFAREEVSGLVWFDRAYRKA
ncbi:MULTISPECIES: flavin reductase family protein [Asaia]|uniref:FMN reductase (NADH) RutF n=1 Tax=Asaia bogorensis NBRC 16594 TaxID=1231624 RepID=A0AAN4U3T0_9PROT|nr:MULTISPECIES: flavin reductase family protein [Asaia]MDL2172304.1 flavin reductase family protein [Asaia sp. HumB]BAT19540.1 flavin mononucleotide FMN reductase [Asaia bogorensis NBRC 16594]GBQ78464.1 flavin mononucleotide reductase [Asaia bogorensis NBRC 16594]GEL53965.1 FMN reductase (NADH) RutF [Asaia bogorensis NBRC 16594]